MNQRNKRITSYFILFSLLIVIGVAFAILQANLQINGIAKISENQWNVHFENIVVNPDSVPIGTGDTAATIDPTNDCKVDFEVTLSLPGDFYEFTVDVKNDGSIDAMIGTLTKSLKINNVETETVPDYLNYTVTYDDDIEILENHMLAKNTKETYKVRVEFKTDIDAEDLPDDTTLSMSIEPQYLQADSEAIIIPHPQELFGIISSNAVMDNIASTYVTNTDGVQFSNQSSDTNGKGLYIRNGTENNNYPIYYYRGAVDNNNILFANFCWKIVRTTDTGGIKLIYNGVPTGENNNECNNTGTDSQLSTTSAFNNASLLYNVGYMYGTEYTFPPSYSIAGWYYAPDVEYANGTYTLKSKRINGTTYNVEKKSNNFADYGGTTLNYHHYTCGSSTARTCTDVMYIYYVSTSPSVIAFRILLSDGKKIEDALSDMLLNSSNENDSVIKTVIDTWYSNNMTSYSSYLEDTIYCNDRSIETKNGWDPDGGTTTSKLQFKTYYRIWKTKIPSLTCTNLSDAFTVSNTIGNGKLTYPVGLLTADELMLAGSILSTRNSTYYLYTGQTYWLMSPFFWESNYGSEFWENIVSYAFGSDMSNSRGVRPVVSIKHGTKILSGDGTSTNPYVVK